MEKIFFCDPAMEKNIIYIQGAKIFFQSAVYLHLVTDLLALHIHDYENKNSLPVNDKEAKFNLYINNIVTKREMCH